MLGLLSMRAVRQPHLAGDPAATRAQHPSNNLSGVRVVFSAFHGNSPLAGLSAQTARRVRSATARIIAACTNEPLHLVVLLQP